MEEEKSSSDSFQPPSPLRSSGQLQAPSEQQEEAEEGSPLAWKGSEEETPAGDDEGSDYNTQTEPSHEYQDEAEPELSQDYSSLDDCSEPELSDGELSDWDSSSQDSSVEEGNSSRDISIFTFGVTPSQPEDNPWDKLTILELYEDEGRAQSLADGLPVPVPREAWVEGQAPESFSASLPSLHSQDSMAQQEPEAGPQSPSAPQPAVQALRQPLAVLRKWRGRLRRALFRCPCQTQE